MRKAAGRLPHVGLKGLVWNTRVFDDNVRHVCATCFDKGKSESCLVKAPAMHASESVLVVGELLCTGVQANTERHTRNETREMFSQTLTRIHSPWSDQACIHKCNSPMKCLTFLMAAVPALRYQIADPVRLGCFCRTC